MLYNENLVRVLPNVKGPKLKSFLCTRTNVNKPTLKNITAFVEFFERYLQKLGVTISY